MPDPIATTMAQAMGKAGPALSATSDMPSDKAPAPALSESIQKGVAKPADAAADPAKVAAEAETAAKADADAAKADADAAKAKADEAAAKPKDDTPPAIKAEITKERNRRRDADAAKAKAEETATKLTEQLQTALRTIEQLTGKGAPADAAKDPRPDRAKFETPDAYDSALIEWTTREATRAASAKQKADTEAAAAKAAEQESDKTREAITKEWNEKREKALEQHPDYEEVAERDDLSISIAMAHAILNADNGPDVAYYLGQNPKEAERIAALTAVKQAIEIGKLSVKLEPKPDVSKAPAPIKPIAGGRGGAGNKDASEMSMDEYAANWNSRHNKRPTAAAKPS